MIVRITITTDNAAFEDSEPGTEVARILSRVAANVTGQNLLPDYFTLADCNGNICGAVQVAQGKEDLA